MGLDTMSDTEIVIYLVVRNDLNMSPGKVAAQCGHGVELALNQGRRYAPKWTPVDPPCAKIVLGADLQQMQELLETISTIHKCVVIDEGRTETEPGTMTVVSLIPMPKHMAKPFVSHLKLYKGSAPEQIYVPFTVEKHPDLDVHISWDGAFVGPVDGSIP